MNRFRQYGLWDRYTDLYPDNDNVGTSNYSKRLVLFSSYKVCITSTILLHQRHIWFLTFKLNGVCRKINDEYHPTTWQINFDLPNVVASGTYTLQLALASTNLAQLRVQTYLCFINSTPT